MNKNINTGSMLRVGTILHGTYRIDGYLSSGGFGNTYVATNIQFDERYAIKEFFMKGVSQRDGNNTTVSVSNTENKDAFQEQLSKFKKEARRLRKLKSEHIVRVYDLFEENGTAYYVMDFIQGENLSEKLKRTGQPLAEDEALSIVGQVLDALKTAHRQGIWHLDLKPANIMVDANGTARLIDFGASKQQSSKGGATSSTAVSYTNGYAPREQMEQNLDKFGPWTDLYALGATLYTLLANQKPPMPSDIDDDRTPDKHLALPMPEGISEPTRTLVRWLMATSRLDRPQSVDEVAGYLNSAPGNPKPGAPADDPSDDDTIRAKQPGRPDAPGQPAPDIKPEQPNEPSVSYIGTERGKATPKRLLAGVVIAAAVGGGIFLALSSHGHDDVAANAGDSTLVEDTGSVVYVSKEALGDTARLFMACTYTGPLRQGLPDGDGEAWFANKSYYKGPFSLGVMEGDNGYFRFENGDVFVGSFHDNHFSKGKYTSKKDGSYFVGLFDADGQPKEGHWYDQNGRRL